MINGNSGSSNTINNLVDLFAQSVIEQDNANTTDEGNKHATHRAEVFRELTTRFGDRGREELTRHFRHESPRVRCMTAAYLLRYKHAEAMVVLQELAKGRGLAAFGAKRTMKNWETGDWQLDPASDSEGE